MANSTVGNETLKYAIMFYTVSIRQKLDSKTSEDLRGIGERASTIWTDNELGSPDVYFNEEFGTLPLLHVGIIMTLCLEMLTNGQYRKGVGLLPDAIKEGLELWRLIEKK